MRNRIMLIYPPGKKYMREECCQINCYSAADVWACNDLGYCAAVLLQRGYEVFLRDYQAEQCEFQQVEQDIRSFHPDLIYIGTTADAVGEDLVFINRLWRLAECYFVLRGAFFLNIPEELLHSLALENVDFLIGCEAERCIAQIADWALKRIGNIKQIPNIIYRDRYSGIFKRTELAAGEKEISQPPFPDRDLMKNQLYLWPGTKAAMATIQVTRGCSRSCRDCLVPRIAGKDARMRPAEHILQEMKECYEKFKIRNFYMKAVNFAAYEEWTADLCNQIISSELYGKIHFVTEARVFPMKRKILHLMKEAGCFGIVYGFVSGSKQTLGEIGTGTTRVQNLMAATWSKREGLLIYSSFMIGFPWETRRHLAETRQHIDDIKPDFLEIAIVPAGTVDSNSLSYERLSSFRKKAILRYYLSPAYLIARLKRHFRKPGWK